MKLLRWLFCLAFGSPCFDCGRMTLGECEQCDFPLCCGPICRCCKFENAAIEKLMAAATKAKQQDAAIELPDCTCE